MILQPKSWNAVDGRQFHHTRFPGSIVAKYVNASGGRGDFKLLHRIIQNDTRFGSTGCIVHLRLGDVIDKATAGVARMWHDWTMSPIKEGDKLVFINRFYVLPRACFTQLIPKLRQHKCSNLTLVTSLHRAFSAGPTQHVLGDAPQSCEYTELVRATFESHGIRVALRVNHTTDDDIRFMYAARVLVKSGGGFSTLMAHLVHGQGRTVLAPNHWGNQPSHLGEYARKRDVFRC